MFDSGNVRKLLVNFDCSALSKSDEHKEEKEQSCFSRLDMPTLPAYMGQIHLLCQFKWVRYAHFASLHGSDMPTLPA